MWQRQQHQSMTREANIKCAFGQTPDGMTVGTPPELKKKRPKDVDKGAVLQRYVLLLHLLGQRLVF